MEALTRLVADSLARHGFDRPIDPRRLQWSRWFRCDSTHSLLVVPSKPGIFALAEEIMDLGSTASETAFLRKSESTPQPPGSSPEGTAFISPGRKSGVSTHQGTESRRDGTNTKVAAPKRMLAVLQFSEDDDMAFTLDRMFTRINPLRERLSSGRCFLRFVVIEDQAQRRSICSALNQWMLSSAEKVSGVGIDFQLSLDQTDIGAARVGRTLPSAGSEPALSLLKGQALSDNADSTTTPDQPTKAAQDVAPKAPHLDSGANKNLHCPHPLPSGF
jgi:hypothetical protein